jgi:myo-inositol-1(or 4)-monophosphatase
MDLDAWRTELELDDLRALLDTATTAARAAGDLMLHALQRQQPARKDRLQQQQHNEGTSSASAAAAAAVSAEEQQSSSETMNTTTTNSTNENTTSVTGEDTAVAVGSGAKGLGDLVGAAMIGHTNPAPGTESSTNDPGTATATTLTHDATDVRNAGAMSPSPTTTSATTTPAWSTVPMAASTATTTSTASSPATNSATPLEAESSSPSLVMNTDDGAEEDTSTVHSHENADAHDTTTASDPSSWPPPASATPAAFQKTNFQDVYTIYDMQAQDVIEEIVLSRYPDHSFLGEESVSAGNSDAALHRALVQAMNSHVLWIVDPIDGTANFASGMALSAVTIAVVYKGTVVVGVVYDPFRNDMFCAIKGQGAYLNDQYLLQVTPRVTTVSDAVINAGCPANVNAYACALRGVQALHGRGVRGVRMMACTALITAWIAAGRLTAHFAYDLNSWDVAAGALLIQEAGGLVTDLYGMPYQLSTRNMLCSNGLVHYEILDLLQDASAVSYTAGIRMK